MSTNSKEYNKQWYLKNKQKRIKQIRDSEKKRVNNNLKYISEYLLHHPCVDCGESDIVVLEFDHTAEDKFGNISNLTRKGYSLETIKNEINKCEVVCANCHRRRTAKRAGWDKKKRSYSLIGKAVDL